ncbi:hypothetical protein [Mucilaginibacter ginkgonis]|uniref:DKNYY family protein n=1 Tax=Mucilaginibacter ginkgonis TaxID=2682091 RepID=A0A7T7FBU1_9SPHI|nr:hypothetical protein [Mucilaginibacter ginkgonis]QQL50452.1 hypothetical protein GO620_003065 [Mucilaginibacter ginkgonis]
MIRFLRITQICALAFCISASALAQSVTADSSANNLTRNRLIAKYHSEIGHQSGLYNGRAYDPNSAYVKGSPYFLNAGWVKGSIVYDGVLYTNVPLKYDMFKDEFAALWYDSFSDYSFIEHRVAAVDLSGHHFITVPGNAEMEGYFDELYNGQSRLLVKRKMVVQAISGISEAGNVYEYKTEFYVFANGRYTGVSNISDVTSLFKTRKKEINAYLKSRNIKFKEDKERALISAVSYYDSINNTK